ncbi:hypothetical protein [Planifilum fimeticola]
MLNRFFSVFMVFLLVFAMVPTAFAGDSGQSAEQGVAPGSEKADRGNGKDDGRDDGETDGKPEMIVRPSVGYTVVDNEQVSGYVKVYAHVVFEESATGKFEMSLDGEDPSELDWEEGVDKLIADGIFRVKKPGTHKLLVRFAGDVDGEEVSLEEEQAVQFPGDPFNFEVTHDGKGTIGGKLSGVKNAEGRWVISVFDPHEEEGLLEEHESDTTSALEYSHTFKGLKPGTYEVRVSYSGTMDGVKATADGLLTVKIGEDASGGVKDPGKGEPPVKEDPDKKGDVIKNPKGGKLPETSTPYPAFALLGSLMLLGGLALLKFRLTGES